jgi:anthrone oxygenase-like protein
MAIGLLSLMVAAIFFGAAFYVNVVEHPARLSLDDKAALTQWKPAYRRGTAMQAPLAILGFILGLVAWWLTARAGFLIGALAMIAPWPWTLLVIKPVNDRLVATDPDKAGPSSRVLLLRWGWLHAVRTALSAVAGIAFLSACLWH